MRRKKTILSPRWLAGPALVGIGLWALGGCGGDEGAHDEGDTADAGGADDHAHDDGADDGHAHDDGADHAHGGEFVAPTSFGGAVHLIEDAMGEIEKALAANRLADIHAPTETISQAARLIGQLALAEGSGVARDAVRDANVAGRELASASDALHEASDAGDEATSRAEFVKMKTHVEILAQLAGDDHGHDDGEDHHGGG